MSTVRPIQKLAENKKDKAWQDANIDYWTQSCTYVNSYVDNLYKLANGELDELDYSIYTKPYGDRSGKTANQGFPAKLRNYPIIPAIINLLMGEKRDRPIIYNVIVNNEDVVNRKRLDEIQLYKNYSQQLYINELNRLGIKTEEESKELPELEQLMSDFHKNWSDSRAELGQEILEFIIQDKKVKEKFIDGFLDFLVTGCVFTFKEPIRDEVEYQILKIRDTGFIGSNHIKFVEDADAACSRLRLTPSEFVDKFYDIIEEEQAVDLLQWLDTMAYNGSQPYNTNLMMVASDVDNGRNYLGNGFSTSAIKNYPNNPLYNYTVLVEYVTWKGWIHIKELEVTNAYGEVERIEVPFEYKESIEDGEVLIRSEWVIQPYEGYRIDSKFFLGFKELTNKRGTFNNPSKSKIGINGRIKKMGDFKALSMVELLAPFQHLYNFGHYKLNFMMSKNKEKLMLMPIGLIPNTDGMDMVDWFYYADATGMAFFDESHDNINQIISSIKSIDLSLGNYINFMYDYINRIKQEAEELIGISRQRKGNVNSTDGLGVNQEANYRSSLITESYFAEYDEFQETEFNGLLDHSKFAYRNGKKGQYISSEGRLALLDIDIDKIDIQSCDYGVRVSSAKKYQLMREKLEHFAEAMAQNGAKGSTLGLILKAEGNFNKLLDTLSEIEEKEAALANEQAQADRDNQLQIQQMMSADKQADRDLKRYEIDTKASTDIEKTLITASAFPDGSEIDVTGLDVNAMETNRLKREEMSINALLKHKEINSKNNLENKKISAELQKANLEATVTRENMQNDKQIAQINAKNRSKTKAK